MKVIVPRYLPIKILNDLKRLYLYISVPPIAIFGIIVSALISITDVEGQTTLTFPATTTWTCPNGVTSVIVECWSGGGAGGAATGNPAAGGGGAGGSYVKNIAIAVVPGTTYTVTVGTGGIGGVGAGPSGGDSWFISSGTILAKGGLGGGLASTNNSTAAGALAISTGNVGFTPTFSYYGGAGGTGGASGASGGGGGSSAGTASNGNPASGITGGTAVAGGGAGVNGSATPGNGAPNPNIGGGGAGGRTNATTDRNGGSGGNGQVKITFTQPSCPLSTAVTPNTTQTGCLNFSANQLTANITQAGTIGSATLQYQWYYNTTNSNTVAGATLIAGATASTYTPLTNTAGTRYYFCVGYATNNSCNETNATQSLASNTVQVTVNTVTATPGTISGSTSQCIAVTGQVYSITAVPGATSYSWSLPSGWSITGGSGTNSITVTVGAGSGNISVFAVNSCGNSSPSSLAVTATAAPTTSDAGPNQNVCTNVGFAILAANTAITGTGVWSVLSGPSLLATQFSNTSNPTANFTPAGGAGTYILRWTISNGTCQSFSNVSIVFSAPPANPNISFDQGFQESAQTISACGQIGGGGQNDIDIYNYTPPTGSTFQWQYSTNGGPWVLAGVPNTTTQYVILSFAGLIGVHQFQLILTTTTGCVVYSNIITLTVNGGSPVGGTATSTCSGTPFSTNITGFPVGTTFTWPVPTVSGGMTGGAGGSSVGTNVSGTLINNTGSAQTANYTLTAVYSSGAPGCTVTVPLVITVTPGSTIVTDAVAAPVCFSASAQTTTLNYSSAIGSPTTYSINWNVAPANSFITVTDAALSSSPIILNVPANTNPGTYTGNITVKNAGGCSSLSLPFTITVNSSSNSITSQPVAPAMICSGNGIINLNVGVTGSGLVYTWRKAGSAVSNGAVISGQGTATLTLTNPTAADAGNYDVIISSTCTSPLTSNTVTVSISLLSADPVSALASATNICSGSSATLSLSGGGGGTSETIAWYTGSCGGTLIGTGNNLIVSPLVTTTYFGRYENGSPCNTNSACKQVTVNVVGPGVWLGVNSDWDDPLNWCGGIPTTSTNVTIPLTASGIYPDLTAEVALVHNLTIASGASINVNNGTIKISGSITNSGLFDLTNGTLELNGTTANQTIAGSMFLGKVIKNLRISNNFSSTSVQLTGTNDTLKLTGILKFGVSSATLVTNNNLTLVSNAAGTASVGDMTNGGANSLNRILGNVTVERYIPNHYKAWQFMAVPTKGQTVNAAWQEGNTPLSNAINPGYGTIITSNISGAVGLGFDVYTPAGPTMKTYDSATNGWVGIANPSIQISNKKGYMLFVRGNRSVTTAAQSPTATILRTTGTLFTSGAFAPQTTNLNSGTFESVGNPYASAIDFNKVTKSGGVQDIFYVWDPNLTSSSFSAYGLGGYQTFIGPGPDYMVIPGGGSYTGSNTYIESGQAFFVHAPFSAGSVSFSESCKVDGSNMVTRPSGTGQAMQLRNNLYVLSGNNKILLDGTISQFDPTYNDLIDELDAIKISNTGENLGIQSNGLKLVAERRSEIKALDTIYYNLGQLRVQQYQFEFIPAAISRPGLAAFLEDNYLHTSTPVSVDDTTRISFNIVNIPGSYAPDRFRLVFQQLIPTPVIFTSISANRNSDKSIAIKWKVDNELNMQLYTVERSEDGAHFTGILTTDPTANNGGIVSYTRNDISPLSRDNFYRIKALSFGGQIQYSAIIKVVPLRSEPAINIFPNPVTGKIIHIQFTDMQAGIYSAQLISGNGTKQSLSEINLNTGNENKELKLPQFIANGIYQLQISGPENGHFIKTIHINDSY